MIPCFFFKIVSFQSTLKPVIPKCRVYKHGTCAFGHVIYNSRFSEALPTTHSPHTHFRLTCMVYFMGRKCEESLKLKKSLKHCSECIFILSVFSPSSFHFPFPFYRVFHPFLHILASSGDSRFAGWEGETAQWVKCLLSLRIVIHAPRTCVKQKVFLCSFSVPTGSGSQTQDSP